MVTDRATSPTGIGQKLKETREARDLTQQDVCDSLNLLVRVVDDMETENWTRLPPAAFTRGYLRSYAKLLGIDSDAADGDKMMSSVGGLATSWRSDAIWWSVSRN